MGRETMTCSRCHRTEGEVPGEWNAMLEDGAVAGHVCPRCQGTVETTEPNEGSGASPGRPEHEQWASFKSEGVPDSAPPSEDEPWIWLDGRWWLVATDTGDGVPDDLGFS